MNGGLDTRAPAQDAAASMSPDAPLGHGAGVGKTDLGMISIADGVVTKIAARAATEIPDAGAAAPRVLGRSMTGVGALGIRQSDLSGLPKTTVRVDGRVALIEISLSVRWPAPIAETTAQVRDRVRTRVQELTGLHVAEITITVTDLVTRLAPKARVR
jgi:uncharacterized alkaline shock family protein YloU